MSVVTLCLSPCLTDSEDFVSQSVKDGHQRNRMDQVSHNRLFQPMVACGGCGGVMIVRMSRSQER